MKPQISTTLGLMRRTIPERRNPGGQRRWSPPTWFPLMDSSGSLVITERRRLSDRRLENTSLADRLLMFSGLVPIDTGNSR